MEILKTNSLSYETDFSLHLRERDNDIIVRNGDEYISVRAIFNALKKRYTNRFRGAVVYSEETFRKNTRLTRAIMEKYFNDRYKVVWAVKSAPIKRLVEIAAEEGASFDVGSYEELALAAAFAQGTRIYHTAPAKFDWDINAIVDNGCSPISDNIVELETLNNSAVATGRVLSAGIRINPAIHGTTQGEIATGTLDCKFGTPELSDDFIDRIQNLSNIDIRILHMHIGSQIATPLDYEKALVTLIKTHQKLAARGIPIDTLDIGGGFPYPYITEPGVNDQPEDFHDSYAFHNRIKYVFEDYIARIHSVLQEHYGKNIPFISVEPGRHIAAGTAFALGYVLSTKVYPNNIRWLISSISVCDIFHKVVVPDTYFDIHVLTEKTGNAVPTAIGGTLCFSGDIMTPKEKAVLLDSAIKRGDILLINNVGAYAVLGSGNFHNMPRLPILLIDSKSNLLEIRKQEVPYFEE